MRLALFGATGRIGQRVLREALARGHDVTAVVRDPTRLGLARESLRVAQGNILDPTSIAAAVAGHDAVISAVGPGTHDDPAMLVAAAHSLLSGLERAGVSRLLVVGGSGSLEVAPGVQFVDTPGFPEARRPISLAQRDALAVYRTEADLKWTYLSPPGSITPGERTGIYRVGSDQLLTDEHGRSAISMEDFAVALIDEVERPAFSRRRFTVAH